jgi:hypothetical protein
MLSIGAVVSVAALAAPEAAAACFGSGQPQRTAALARAFTAAPPALAAQAPPAARTSIAGMWLTDFLLGDGPDVYDQMFQQYHQGGTETSLSNGLPPVLGNVCLGIWQAIGPWTFVVKHVAWNWNPDHTLAGTFVLEFEVTVDASGLEFDGSWSASNFDLEGTHLADLDADGLVRGARITID